MAVPASGANSQLVIVPETTYGVTPGTPAGKILGITSFSVKATQNLIDNTTLSADPSYRDAVKGKKDGSGQLQTNLNILAAPALFKFLTGSLATTGAGDPYTHVSKIIAGALPSWSAEEKFVLPTGDDYTLATGLCVDTFKVQGGVEGFVVCDFGLMASNVTHDGSSVFTAPTDWSTADQFHHLQLAAADVKLGGSAFDGFSEFSIEVNNNLYKDDYRAGGAGTRASITRGKTKVSGSIKAMYDSLTLYNILVADAPTSLSFKWTIGANRSLKIDLPRVWFERTDPAMQDAGPVSLSANFTAVYDNTAQSPIVFTVVNDQAGTVYA